MNVLLVGCGNIAISYIKVIQDLNVDYQIIGNSEENSKEFSNNHKCKVISGGLYNGYNELCKQPTHAIIATPINILAENALFLIEKGVKNILIEKPGALNKQDLFLIKRSAENKKVKVFIAYNRRFYASINELLELTSNEKITSIFFEFTEWSHMLVNKNLPKFKLENWFIANSTHLVDLAFYIGGRPKNWCTYIQSKLDWHPKGSIFVGSGITERDIMFSYHANWNAPGSWRVEVSTAKNKYILRPIEELKVQKHGNIENEEIKLNSQLDTFYKPGFYKQLESFLTHPEDKRLLTINEAIRNFEIFDKMLSKINEVK
ncbi:Gfo/Idh/MocA family oxidoreductase [Ureibacillus chungkukjangi]|uniref:Gfo/Idh/MocA family protein n=1 Tax=Ureibacillus chungkukjangi TaxID=1202712 RepID=UPI0020405001|nr:Gfo/Idh/MocA family oxidoreductase [Ureibacillus chungkukjangi]MCM3389081.1 Gfo/Idh/MocA family oxidoreductase [Ureibacillus chungkukjangi]